MRFADKRLWTGFGISHSVGGGCGCNCGAKKYTKKSRRERQRLSKRERERDTNERAIFACMTHLGIEYLPFSSNSIKPIGK